MTVNISPLILTVLFYLILMISIFFYDYGFMSVNDCGYQTLLNILLFLIVMISGFFMNMNIDFRLNLLDGILHFAFCIRQQICNNYSKIAIFIKDYVTFYTLVATLLWTHYLASESSSLLSLISVGGKDHIISQIMLLTLAITLGCW